MLLLLLIPKIQRKIAVDKRRENLIKLGFNKRFVHHENSNVICKNYLTSEVPKVLADQIVKPWETRVQIS